MQISLPWSQPACNATFIRKIKKCKDEVRTGANIRIVSIIVRSPEKSTLYIDVGEGKILMWYPQTKGGANMLVERGHTFGGIVEIKS